MDINKLKELTLFSEMSRNEIEQVMSSSGTRSKKYSKGDVIHYQGDEVTGLYILCEGCIKNIMDNEFGKSVTVEKMNAPALFAPAFIFATDNHFPVTVVALTECEVAVVPRESLLKQMKEYDYLMLSILKITSDRCSFLSRRLREFALFDLKTRIRDYIKHNGPITNQAEVAQILGVARPSLARALSEIAREK